MRKTILLPNYFQKIGWLLLVPSLIFGIYDLIAEPNFLSITLPHVEGFDQFEVRNSSVDFTATFAIIINLLSFVFIALSREKIEDECISHLRTNAMLTALWGSILLIIVASLFVYDFAYLYILIFNLYFYLVLYIIKFRIELSKFYKTKEDE